MVNLWSKNIYYSSTKKKLFQFPVPHLAGNDKKSFQIGHPKTSYTNNYTNQQRSISVSLLNFEKASIHPTLPPLPRWFY